MRRLGRMLGTSVVLLAAAASGQEGKKAAPPAAPQDRVDLPVMLDSWYRITQGDQDAGFLHETLERVSGAWRFNYTVQSETELMVRNPKDPAREVSFTESLTVNAKLDDTYSPVDLNMKYAVNGVDITGSIVSTEGGRCMQVIFPNGDRKEFQFAAEEDLFCSFQLMFISMRQNGLLANRGSRKGRVFFLRTDAPPMVDVVFDVGEMVKRDLPAKKGAAVTKITYIKPPPSISRDYELAEAYVDKFGRIVEASTQGGIKCVLVLGEEEAVGKGGKRLSHKGRRDPFRKDLVMAAKKQEGDGGKDGVAPPTTLDVTPGNLPIRLSEATKLLDELKKACDKGQTEEGEGIYQKILGYYLLMRPVAAKDQPNVLPKVEDLKKTADKISGIPARLRDQARPSYVDALDAFNREAPEEMERKLNDLLKFQNRRELQNTEELLEINRWVADLEPRLAKCKTRVELARKKLVLTGTVSQFEEVPQKVNAAVDFFGHRVGAPHEVRFIRAVQYAVINDKLYRVGETVEGQGVRVEKIWMHGVMVSMKDETRDVGIRQ